MSSPLPTPALALHALDLVRPDGTVTLRGLDLLVPPGRSGLVGANGSGKSTVLRLAAGQLAPTAGHVTTTGRVGLLPQDLALDTAQPVEDFLGLGPVRRALRRIESGSVDEADFDAVGDDWDVDQRAHAQLEKLGLPGELLDRRVGEVSGGEAVRLALAGLLLARPDVLLLDEPTNFLDVAGIAWLERWLRDFRGALLVVSHDRAFLEQVVTSIVEIENHHLQTYDGSYSDYVQQKQFRLKNLEREFSNEQQLLAYEQEAISDRKEAVKNPTGVLKRRLANIKKSKNPRPVDTVVTAIYSGLHVHDNLAEIAGISKSYGEQQLFDNLSFSIHRGDRIAITGPNGCGKTTLVDILTESEKPDSGKIKWKTKAPSFIYYNQVLADLDLDDTVTHSVNAMPDSLALTATKKEVNRFLTLLQFSEMDLKTRIGVLSGGQKARVALAQCLLFGAGVIVLDEPTNHLDLQSTQVLERALMAFPGAVIIVSHDRFFVEKVAFRQLSFDGHGSVKEIAGVQM